MFDLGFLNSSKGGSRYLLCRPPCKHYVVEVRNNKEELVQKPVFENLDTYFAELRRAFRHMLINGEASLRADGVGLHYAVASGCSYEVVNLAKW